MTGARWVRCTCSYNMHAHTQGEISVHACDACLRWRVDTADGSIRGRGRAELNETLHGLDLPELARVAAVLGRDCVAYTALLARHGITAAV